LVLELFNDAFLILRIKWQSGYEWWIEEDVKESGRGLFECIVTAFFYRTEELREVQDRQSRE
jgi:hypothetical protein